MFFGRYDYTVDPKGRVNFPAKFRESMGEGPFVVMQWVDGCLFALSMEQVDAIAERMGGNELMTSWETTGDLFSTATEVLPDKQGRILIPEELRRYADLDKNVTIIGNRNHVELWNTEAWNARRAAISDAERKRRLQELHI